MKVHVGIYETPQPTTSGETEKKFHARVQSKGIRRLSEICDTLYGKGINSAQIKAVLDGIAIYIGESLREGYTLDMEEVGIFSLSMATETETNENGEMELKVAVNGVNFRPSPTLRKRIRWTEIYVDKSGLKKKKFTLEERKKKLKHYLENNVYIYVLAYSQLQDCSRYQAEKDLDTFCAEGFLTLSGKKHRKVYTLTP